MRFLVAAGLVSSAQHPRNLENSSVRTTRVPTQTPPSGQFQCSPRSLRHRPRPHSGLGTRGIKMPPPKNDTGLPSSTSSVPWKVGALSLVYSCIQHVRYSACITDSLDNRTYPYTRPARVRSVYEVKALHHHTYLYIFYFLFDRYIAHLLEKPDAGSLQKTCTVLRVYINSR